MEIGFQQNCTVRRFEFFLDGRTQGFIEYYLCNDVVIITHTEVDPRWEGKGFGSRLARQALDYFRRKNHRVVPVCGFFAHQIRRYPEYADLVTRECRRIFNL